MNLHNTKRLTDLENELTAAGGGDEGKQQGVRDGYTHTAIKWITSKALLKSAGDSAQCYMASRMGEVFGGEWIHVYVWLRPFAVHLNLSQRCSSAVPQYKIKS